MTQRLLLNATAILIIVFGPASTQRPATTAGGSAQLYIFQALNQLIGFCIFGGRTVSAGRAAPRPAARRASSDEIRGAGTAFVSGPHEDRRADAMPHPAPTQPEVIGVARE